MFYQPALIICLYLDIIQCKSLKYTTSYLRYYLVQVFINLQLHPTKLNWFSSDFYLSWWYLWKYNMNLLQWYALLILFYLKEIFQTLFYVKVHWVTIIILVFLVCEFILAYFILKSKVTSASPRESFRKIVSYY